MATFVNKEPVNLEVQSGNARLSGFGFRKTYRYFGKRALDVTLVLLSAPIVLVVLLPVLFVVAMSGGSPIYVQDRIGRKGRTFHLWKVRTMVVNADQKLAEYLSTNPLAKEEWDRTQKLKRDPRITPVGRFLRKSSLDELPQLWNVLRGDMSLIGPRPMMTSQRGLYPGRSYFSLRPGITGSWQVSERNESSFADRARYDTEYFRTLSFRADLKILWKTVSVVLRGTGY